MVALKNIQKTDRQNMNNRKYLLNLNLSSKICFIPKAKMGNKRMFTKKISFTGLLKAIKKGIQILNKDDILLVLGKGHEAYQIIGSVKYPFDDKEVVLNYIRR